MHNDQLNAIDPSQTEKSFRSMQMGPFNILKQKRLRWQCCNLGENESFNVPG